MGSLAAVLTRAEATRPLGREKLAADTGISDDGASWGGIALARNVASDEEVRRDIEEVAAFPVRAPVRGVVRCSVNRGGGVGVPAGQSRRCAGISARRFARERRARANLKARLGG